MIPVLVQRPIERIVVLLIWNYHEPCALPTN